MRLLFTVFVLGVFNYSMAQSLSFDVTDARCESDGIINVTLDTGDGSEEFFVTAGPSCSDLGCPFADTPDGQFSSLMPGIYTVEARDENGNIIVSQNIELRGTYMEPLQEVSTVFACSGGSDAQIMVDNVLDGNDPFEHRAFPGTVMDYSTPIGMPESSLPFTNSNIFTGLDPFSNLYDEITGSVSSDPNPNGTVWTVQVKDSCNVIRTSEVVLGVLPEITNIFYTLSCGQNSCSEILFDFREIFIDDIFFLESQYTNINYSALFPIEFSFSRNNDNEIILFEWNYGETVPDFSDVLQIACDDTLNIKVTDNCAGVFVKDVLFPCNLNNLSTQYDCESDSTKYIFNIGTSAERIDCLENYSVEVFDCSNDSLLQVLTTIDFIPGSHSVVFYLEGNLDLRMELVSKCTSDIFDVKSESEVVDDEIIFQIERQITCDSTSVAFFYNAYTNVSGYLDVELTSAPPEYNGILPHLKTVLTERLYGPPGEYCFKVEAPCGSGSTDTCFIFGPAYIEYEMNQTTTCQTNQLIVNFRRINVGDDLIGSGRTTGIGAIIKTNENGFTSNVQSLDLYPSIENSVSIDIPIEDCGINYGVYFQALVESTSNPGTATYVDCEPSFVEIECYENPDGIEVSQFPCFESSACNEGAINTLINSPLIGGEAPYTFWIFDKGETIECCTPLDEIITNDTFAVFENICVEDLPLDIFVTDDCGMQIMAELNFGVGQPDLLIRDSILLCSQTSVSLDTIINDQLIVDSNMGSFTGLNGAPFLSAFVFNATQSQVDQCFEYEYNVPVGSFPGQCGEYRDSIFICVEDCSAICNIDPIQDITAVCNNGGTPNDSNDDYVTFSLNATGTGTSYTISSTGNGSFLPASGTFGTNVDFQFTPSGTWNSSILITISDNSTELICIATFTLTIPNLCSQDCPTENCLGITVTKTQN